MIFGLRTFHYATRAIIRKLWRLMRGLPLLSDKAEQEARRAVCRTCEHLTDAQCDICTCFVELKTMWVDEFCPDNPPRWK